MIPVDKIYETSNTNKPKSLLQTLLEKQKLKKLNEENKSQPTLPPPPNNTDITKSSEERTLLSNLLNTIQDTSNKDKNDEQSKNNRIKKPSKLKYKPKVTKSISNNANNDEKNRILNETKRQQRINSRLKHAFKLQRKAYSEKYDNDKQKYHKSHYIKDINKRPKLQKFLKKIDKRKEEKQLEEEKRRDEKKRRGYKRHKSKLKYNNKKSTKQDDNNIDMKDYVDQTGNMDIDNYSENNDISSETGESDLIEENKEEGSDSDESESTGNVNEHETKIDMDKYITNFSKNNTFKIKKKKSSKKKKEEFPPDTRSARMMKYVVPLKSIYNNLDEIENQDLVKRNLSNFIHFKQKQYRKIPHQIIKIILTNLYHIQQLLKDYSNNNPPDRNISEDMLIKKIKYYSNNILRKITQFNINNQIPAQAILNFTQLFIENEIDTLNTSVYINSINQLGSHLGIIKSYNPYASKITA